MKKSLPLLLIALATALLHTGCVVGRRTVSIPVTPLAAPAEATKGEVHIASVTDNRKFENKPDKPSTPSIDGDVATLTPEQKDSMIGRQRGGFGNAMGDVDAAEGQSATKQSRLLIEAALKSRGYKISDSPTAGVSVDVSVDRFWAWSTPMGMGGTFEARINCTLTLKRDGRETTVVLIGEGTNYGMNPTSANWAKAYIQAFEDFLKKAEPELEKAGY